MDRITVNKDIMVGKPIIRNTRITVEQILRWLAQGQTTEEIIENYPQLQPEDIQAALGYAAETMKDEQVFARADVEYAG